MKAERDGAGAEEPWLAELLRAEADRHVPDLDVVRRRLAQERPVRRRRGGAVWAVAGVLVTVAAGGFAVAGITDLVAASGHTGEVRVVPATPSVTVRPSVTPSETPSEAPSAATRSTPDSRLLVRPAVAGQRVNLAGALDWVIAGSRPDGTTVRRVAGGQALGGPHLVGDPRAETARGPFRTTWTGGLPDATGADVDTWLTVRGRAGGPRTGFLVSAPADASSLTLYTGAGTTSARITVLVNGRTREETKLPSTPSGHVVTIAVDGPGRVEVRVDTTGDGTVALAAAVAR